MRSALRRDPPGDMVSSSIRGKGPDNRESPRSQWRKEMNGIGSVENLNRFPSCWTGWFPCGRAVTLFSSYWSSINYDCNVITLPWVATAVGKECQVIHTISNSFQNNPQKSKAHWGWRTKKRCMHPSTHQSYPIPSHHPIPSPCPSPSLFFIISPPPSAQFQTKIKSHRLSLLDLILPNYIIKSPHFSQLNFRFSPPPFFFHPTSYILATLHPIICSHFSSQKSQRVFRSQRT